MIKKILIADDSPVARKILRSCLPKDEGLEIHEAGDGKAAWLKYQELRPDVTFMDLTMPVMDGLEALSRIREFDADALVIVSTADVQKKTIEKVSNLGAFTLLKKPPTKELVQTALKEAQASLDGRK